MARRDRIALALVLSALAGFLLALALPAHAQESASPAPDGAAFVFLPGVAWHAQPLFLALCGALISMGIGALKRSAAGAWLDKSALRDIAAVFIASVVAALPHLAAGLVDFGYSVLGHIIAATMAWAAANGAAKVARERTAQAIDDAASKL